MNSDGSIVTSVAISGAPDLEGVCVADPSSDFIYFWVEGSSSGREGIALHDGVLYIAEDYGKSTPAGNIAAYSPFVGVPEPSSVILLGIAAFWLVFVRRVV